MQRSDVVQTALPPKDTAYAASLAAGLQASGLRAGERGLALLSSSGDIDALLAACRMLNADVMLLPATAGPDEISQASAALFPKFVVADVKDGPVKTAMTLEDLNAAMPLPDKMQASGETTAQVLFPSNLLDEVAAVFPCPQSMLLSSAKAIAARLGITAADHLAVMAEAVHPVSVLMHLAAGETGAAISRCSGRVPKRGEIAGMPASATVLIVPDVEGLMALIRGRVAYAPCLSGLRQMVVQAPGRMIPRAQKAFPGVQMLNSWSIAETAGLASLCDPADPVDTAIRTHGRPLPGVEVMIVDPRTGLDNLLFERGEIWLRTRPRFQGYIGAKRGIGHIHRRDGFLRTGLMGMLDQEGRVIL
ncbi:AMP-binding protein [Rhodophyticola sp. CCM32]|uniref:AMP-binding protein n=1 Tax=Rhodophyticola sp. CCM32 TaxID=2916397 RepID=UPI00143D3448|nr:class I adenylate-forming enzyme family protein [Rhodophyticola sp. CCM32]